MNQLNDSLESHLNPITLNDYPTLFAARRFSNGHAIIRTLPGTLLGHSEAKGSAYVHLGLGRTMWASGGKS